MYRDICDVIDHLTKYEGISDPRLDAIVRRAVYHAPVLQHSDWVELADVLYSILGEPQSSDKSKRVMDLVAGGLLVCIVDVPVNRRFKVWQTGEVFIMRAKSSHREGILAQADNGGFWANENLKQLVELLPDDIQ